MPIGSISAFPLVINLLAQRQPKSVLDLGVGMGMYGAGVRQWLDNGVAPYGVRLIGVEGFSGYRNPCWLLYTAILEMPIEHALPALASGDSRFDAIVMGDVLEHFERPAGEALIPQLEALLSPTGVLAIVTPAIWIEQGAAHGNELERHRSQWCAGDFTSRGFSLLLDGTPDPLGSRMIAAWKARA